MKGNSKKLCIQLKSSKKNCLKKLQITHFKYKCDLTGFEWNKSRFPYRNSFFKTWIWERKSSRFFIKVTDTFSVKHVNLVYSEDKKPFFSVVPWSEWTSFKASAEQLLMFCCQVGVRLWDQLHKLMLLRLKPADGGLVITQTNNVFCQVPNLNQL